MVLGLLATSHTSPSAQGPPTRTVLGEGQIDWLSVVVTQWEFELSKQARIWSQHTPAWATREPECLPVIFLYKLFLNLCCPKKSLGCSF